MRLMSECPTDKELRDVVSDDCTDDNRLRWEDHIGTCQTCQDRLSKGTSASAWTRLLHQPSQAEIDTNADSMLADTGADSSASSTAEQHPEFQNYTILTELGRGGMGVVFRARHHRLNRDVALKVLSRSSANNPERWLRFRTEAQAIARLHHPNIIQIFDSGEENGIPYVAQELADGGTLGQRVSGTPQPATDAAHLAGQLADAVAHAHENGVLHRDIKPSNVLFCGDTVKLADFGLAKLIDGETDLTETKDVIGTPAYMAPEQAAGDRSAIGKPTDVFTLGILLYEMLTGVTPFRAETAVQTLHLILDHDPVPPRQLQPGVPRDLDTICLKCLSKKPRDRYQNANELSGDLNRFLDGYPIKARPTPIWKRVMKWCRRHPSAASLLGVSLVAIVLLLVIWASFTRQLAKQKGIADDQRTIAETQRTIAEQKTIEANTSLAEQVESNAATQEVLEFLTTGLFDSAIPENDGIELRVVDVLETAGETIEERFHDRPIVEAAVRASIGNTFLQLGVPLRALPHLERSTDLYRWLDSVSQAKLQFDAEHAHAICLTSLNKTKEARLAIERLLESSLDQSVEKQMAAKLTFAGLLLKERKLDESLRYTTELLAECRDTLGEGHKTTLTALGQIGVVHFAKGDMENALKTWEQHLEATRRFLGEDNPETMTAVGNVAVILANLGRHTEAEALHRENWQRNLRMLGAKHTDTITTKHNLAMAIWRMGQHKEATTLLCDVIAELAEVFGPVDHRTLQALYETGRMYLEMKTFGDGVELYDRHIKPHLQNHENTGRWIRIVLVYAKLQAGAGEFELASDLVEDTREALTDKNMATPHLMKTLAEAETFLKKSEDELFLNTR